MIRITPGGSQTATSSNVTYEIIEKLCRPYNTNGSFSPVVTKTWSVASTETVSGVTYFGLQCVVGVTYLPKGACSTCGQKTNTFIENVTVSFVGTGTIAITDSNGYTEPSYTSGCCRAQGIDNVGSLEITFTAS